MELLAWLIIPLLLLVAVPHELGHLLAARLFGIRVLEFGIGLPPRAASFSFRGIRWTICWLLPLGAFVRLKGEDEGREPDDFAGRPAWQRGVVATAGPAMNVLVALAAVVLGMLLVGRPTGLRPVVTSVQQGSPAAVVGLLPGDVLVNGGDSTPTLGLGALGSELAARGGLEVERNGATYELAVPSGAPSTWGADVRRKMTYERASDVAGALASLASLPSGLSARSDLPADGDTLVLGWVGLAQLMDELADAGIPPIAWFCALLASLSLGLGVANLLPIPPLDGSRVLYSGLEAATRRRVVGPKLGSRLNVAGLVLLVCLFLAVTGADLARVLSGRLILTQ